MVRVLSDRLAERLGQAVVIENKPGASGYIGAQMVAKARPDGYTLLLGFDGSIAVAPHLIKAPFDAEKDFAPVTKLSDATLVLASSSELPVKSLPELLEYSKTHDLEFGSSGLATTTHLAGELLALRSGMNLRHIPYKGGGQAVIDVAGGQIPLIFTVIPTVAGFLKDGRINALAVSTQQRTAVLPDVPAIAESFPGYDVSSWYGLFAPAGTPPDVLLRLQREVAEVLKTPEVTKQYETNGFVPVGNTPDEFAAQVAADVKKWAEVVKEADVSLN